MSIEKRQQIEAEIAHLNKQIEQKKNELLRIERECNNGHHNWSDPWYDPIRTEGYMFEGDPPGTMGVDRRPSMYIPASVTERWKRKCKTCGKVEHTTHFETKTQTSKHPSFPKY